MLAGIVGTIYEFETPISLEVQALNKGVKGGYKEQVLYNPLNLISYLERLNIHACLISPGGNEQIIRYLDLVVIPGGYDVHPALYGQEPIAETIYEKEGTRDRFEMRLIQLALEMKKPILAICRGFQMVNVALGGTLHQHLPYWSDLVIHRPVDGPHVLSHSVSTTGWLADILGTEIMVNSWHHQGVDRLANELEPLAWAKDGLIEAYQSKASCPSPIFAVQWHPEILQDENSFSMLRHFLQRIGLYDSNQEKDGGKKKGE